MRILVVEDDRRLAEILVEALTDQFYVVDMALEAESALKHIKTSDYDLLLLDVMLPELDGISFCSLLRAQGYQMPILMVTARDTVSDKISGLDAGADDYIVKPVDLGELFARIRALLRRGNTALPPVLEWGKLRLDPSVGEVRYAQTSIYLTPKEFCILELLMRHGRRLLSRRAIIQNIWQNEDTVEEDTVKVHVRSLRQKLKGAGAPENLIETVHSRGYRLFEL
ncbi:response regulator transcription factor [Oscillatoria sp. FACHB-1406]|uniref:response regulator transcription factor n=1 Tax=Oscillatoria sp. FACHB-1406 TaxID=2692846 RepID=UPI0016862F00|nr:response regulator transcription factor [Oscillatoria sp. FACHB-1406]MBD2579369.1 response regulator transcription factor [Oscillatoria sp. FACHB-1406]